MYQEVLFLSRGSNRTYFSVSLVFSQVCLWCLSKGNITGYLSTWIVNSFSEKIRCIQLKSRNKCIIESFICQYLLDTHYVPGIALSTRGKVVSKTWNLLPPASMELSFCRRQQTIKIHQRMKSIMNPTDYLMLTTKIYFKLE